MQTLLRHGANVNDQALCGATALHYAAEDDNPDICELLLDHGAQILPNQNNMTPVLCAAQYCYETVVNMFIYRPGLMRIEEVSFCFVLPESYPQPFHLIDDCCFRIIGCCLRYR